MENCFLYCPFSVAATALFLFRLTKSRRTFYAQIECLCFHTASVELPRSGTRARRSGIRREPTIRRAVKHRFGSTLRRRGAAGFLFRTYREPIYEARSLRSLVDGRSRLRSAFTSLQLRCF